MVKGYLTANEIINEALSDIRDDGRKYYADAAKFFVRGYREFKLFHAGGELKDTWRPIDINTRTVNFPEDLLRLFDVGVIVRGEFFSFTKGNKMVGISNPIDTPLNSDRGEDDTIDRSPSFGYGTKGQNVEYYYREDRPNRRLFLSRLAIDQTIFADRTEVLFKYVSNGITDFDNTFIAADAANLLISYIVYKLVCLFPEKYNAQYRAEKKEEYNEQWHMYDALELPSLSELEDVIYETSSQNVRRV